MFAWDYYTGAGFLNVCVVCRNSGCWSESLKESCCIRSVSLSLSSLSLSLSGPTNSLPPSIPPSLPPKRLHHRPPHPEGTPPHPTRNHPSPHSRPGRLFSPSLPPYLPPSLPLSLSLSQQNSPRLPLSPTGDLYVTALVGSLPSPEHPPIPPIHPSASIHEQMSRPLKDCDWYWGNIPKWVWAFLSCFASGNEGWGCPVANGNGSVVVLLLLVIGVWLSCCHWQWECVLTLLYIVGMITCLEQCYINLHMWPDLWKSNILKNVLFWVWAHASLRPSILAIVMATLQCAVTHWR